MSNHTTPEPQEPPTSASQQRYQLSSDAQPFIPSFMRGAASTAATGTASVDLPAGNDGHTVATAQALSGRGRAGGRAHHRTRGRGSARHLHRGAVGFRPSRGPLFTRPAHRDAPLLLSPDMFDLLINALQDDEIDMLMNSMPDDILQIYNTHMTHYMRCQQGGRVTSQGQDSDSAPPGGRQLTVVRSAAVAAFNDLELEQKRCFENCLASLAEESAIEDYRDGLEEYAHELYGVDVVDAEGADIFVNEDADLGADEEEWLLVQMMELESALHSTKLGRRHTRASQQNPREPRSP